MLQRFGNVDWGSVIERLTLVAYQLFATRKVVGGGPAVPGFGTGPEDLAQQVVCALWDPDDHAVTWNEAKHGAPTTEGVTRFLATVMRNDFLDQRKSKRRKVQGPMEVVGPDGAIIESHEPLDPTADAVTLLVDAESAASFRERLDDDFSERPDDELQLYIWELFKNGEYQPYKPQEAADLLGVPVEKIYRLKERFARRIRRLYAVDLPELTSAAEVEDYEQKAG